MQGGREGGRGGGRGGGGREGKGNKEGGGGGKGGRRGEGREAGGAEGHFCTCRCSFGWRCRRAWMQNVVSPPQLLDRRHVAAAATHGSKKHYEAMIH